MLNISSKHGEPLSSIDSVKLDIKDLNKLISNTEKVPDQGTILDKGYIWKYRILIYQFTNTIRCSDASDTSVELLFTENDIITPPIKINRNVAWSFYGLDQTEGLDDFVCKEKAILKSDFIYPEPDMEHDRMECLEKAISCYYDIKQNSEVKGKRVINPGLMQNYCQFSGGGDIHIYANPPGTFLIINQLSEDEKKDLSVSPIDDSTMLSYVIEGKKAANYS